MCAAHTTTRAQPAGGEDCRQCFHPTDNIAFAAWEAYYTTLTRAEDIPPRQLQQAAWRWYSLARLRFTPEYAARALQRLAQRAPDTARAAFYSQVIRLGRSSGHTKTLTQGYLWRGRFQLYQQQLAPAFADLSHAAQLAETHQLVQQQAQANWYLAVVRYFQERFTESLHYSLKSLHHYRQLQDSLRLMDGLNNIALLFLSQEEFGKAKTYLLQAYPMAHQLGRQDRIALLADNLGICYQQLGLADSALHYATTALEIYQQLQALPQRAKVLHNLGNIYLDLEQPTKAQPYYQRSYALHQQLGDSLMLALNQINLATVYSRQGLHGQAIRVAETALQRTRQLGYTEQRLQALAALHEIYAEAGRHRTALQTSRRYAAIRDTFISQDRLRNLGLLLGQYEIETAQRRRATIEQQLLQSEQARQRQQYYLLLGLAVAVVAGLLWLLRSRLSQRLTEALSFFGVLLLFEALMVYLDPYLTDYTGGVPLPILLINSALAVAFTGLHLLLVRTTRRRKA